MATVLNALNAQVLTLHRFSVDEYQLMGEVGILSEDSRVELFDGEVVSINPIGEQHLRNVNRLTRLLVFSVGSSAIVSIQNPIVLSQHDEPQPDVVVLRSTFDQHPGKPVPDDVLLLIEIADSTLVYDRDLKLPRYAGSGIPEAWIVDLNARTVTRYTEPTDQGYRVATVFRPGERISSTTEPTLSLVVNDILPQ